MATTRHSVKRDAILNNLKMRKDHPTADMVYADIRKEYPNISLGTVYRNLTFLVDHGDAMKVICGDDETHFDGNTSPHYHFKCLDCGELIDLDIPDGDKAEQIFSRPIEGFAGKVYTHSTMFFGQCELCAKKAEKKAKQTKVS